MKYLYALLALLTLQAHASSFFEVGPGDPPDHLTPLRYPPTPYDRVITERLCADRGVAKFVVRPSFEPESCVSVYAAEDQASYFISVTRPGSKIWNVLLNNDWKLPDGFEFSRTEREISPELAVAIQRAWAGMLVRTGYARSFSRGLDGDTYQFSAWVRGLGELYGEAWSPDAGLPADMVALGQSLIEFTEDGRIDSTSLLQRLRDFESKTIDASSR